MTGPSLLVVDDNEDNRYLLVRRLKREGYTDVSEVEDGRSALRLMREKRFDLVLLDVMMPEMTGYEVLEQMREDDGLREIPVIVISALDEVESAVRCIEAGAEDYLPKPFNVVLLRARIRASLEKKRLRDETLKQLEIIRSVFGKYVPSGVAEAVVAGEGNLAPELVSATIMYTDIEAFTATAEAMEPERVVAMLNDYFPAVIEPVIRHGGIVNQFQGDAMLITFNVPVRDPSHADQALRAAGEIQQVLAERTFGGAKLRTRIGINTGKVIAGNVGSGERVNYTVHGDAVNLAARLERMNKEYNSLVLVSENTVTQLAGDYELKAMGEVAIRGKAERVKIYAQGPGQVR